MNNVRLSCPKPWHEAHEDMAGRCLPHVFAAPWKQKRLPKEPWVVGTLHAHRAAAHRSSGLKHEDPAVPAIDHEELVPMEKEPSRASQHVS